MSQRAELPRLFWISPGRGLGPQLETRLRSCVRAGLRAFQLREKGSFASDLLGATRKLRELMPEGLLLVNDRVDVAQAGGADGVHLGSHALPASEARALLGEQAWIGASVHDERELETAVQGGADFAFVSPVYPVEKPGHKTARALGPLGLRSLVERCPLPVFALGGVRPERVPELLDAGVHGVAVLSGIGAAADPAAAVQRYLEALEACS